MLDVDDLIGWAVDHYMANIQQKMKTEQGLELPDKAVSKDDVNSEVSGEVIQYRKCLY